MKDYLNQYKVINKQFSSIIEESLKNKNLQVHAKVANFIEDYETWVSLINNAYEVTIYKEALSEYKAMLLFWNMGLYKYSFMALRGYFELTLFGIQLSSNELNFRLWKQSELDLYWSQIMDEENGIFSKQFIKAFQPSFVDDAKSIRQLAKSVYRECSEYIHSNYNTTNFLPEKTCFDQEVFELIGNKVETINQIITFVFCVRYLELVNKSCKLIDFENCIMDSIGFLPCIREIYK